MRSMAILALLAVVGCGPANPTLPADDGDVPSGDPSVPDGPDGGGDPLPSAGDPAGGDAADPADSEDGDGDPAPGDPPPGDPDPEEPLPGDPTPEDPPLGDPDPGDPLPGDPAPEDPPPPARFVCVQDEPWSDCVLIAADDRRCLADTAVLLLSGPAYDPWRVSSSDVLGRELGLLPTDGPGQLVPEYLGAGAYSDEGYATVLASGLPDAAAVHAIDIGPERWSLESTCPAPLLTAVVYPAGPSGEGTAIASGDTLCPQTEPWTVVVQTPADSRYAVVILDFTTGAVTELDETTLLQEADGDVVLPPLPVSGRAELTLLGLEGLEVERVLIYLDC